MVIGARRGAAAVVPVLAVLACGGGNDAPPGPSASPAEFRLERVASGLDDPVHLTAPPGDTARLFIVEQAGRVRILEGGRLLAEPFLDIADLVRSGGEQGLLSLAFHPRFAETGRFFVYYTDRQGDTRVVEYRRGADPDRADPASARVLLSVGQPYANHNGGLILFGPDGYLYIGLGDGGGAGDPLDNGQNPATLLGTILRIDVDAGEPYGIPADNPFIGRSDARPELWAYGLRNPWRYAFDRGTGDLYIADVGQNRWEEVNVEPAGSGGGRNYGWNIMEGDHCFGAADCPRQGLAPPVHEYSHDDGCSISGGHVYRGEDVPAVRGLYFFSDYCEGGLRSFRWRDGRVEEVREWDPAGVDLGRVTAFGEDARGELYILSAGGEIHRIAAAE